MSEPEARTFTPAEAEALIPWLSERLTRIREARQRVLAGARHLSKRAARNGGGAPGRDYWQALSTLRRDVGAIAERGIALRDPEAGLVDFPSERDGRPVFLCWRLGEEGVGFWHEADSGFAGRRPL